MKVRKKYKLSKPYHGELFSLWFIIDKKTGEMVGSSRDPQKAQDILNRWNEGYYDTQG